MGKVVKIIKDYVIKIPYSLQLYNFLNYKISRVLSSKREKEYSNKVFFDREKISIRKGPVVLVSREIGFTFPLSYAYLAGYLKERNIDVVILFRNIDRNELVKKILKLKPILVGFGNLYPELDEIRNIIYRLNRVGRDFPIVIGGQMVSPTPEFAMKLTGADYGVIGEGEIILYELVNALQKNTDISKIGGLAIRTGNEVLITGSGEYIKDLSKLPKIPYELFDTDQWLQIGRWYTRYRPDQAHWRFSDKVINVHGGRGCPYRCNFCYHHNIPRYRSMDDMMDEAEESLDKFDANMLYFSDDLVIANSERVVELIDRVRRLKKPISYSISTRFDILERLSDALLEELKATGCRIIGLGIESGSDKVLKTIGKNITVGKIRKGLKRLKKVGIIPTVSIMVGQYNETRNDVMKSIKLVKETVRDNPLINYAFTIVTPFPGSPLHDLIFQKKLLKSEEEFYDLYILGRVGDWNQVVNLSKMSDREVVKLRDEIEKIYLEEKLKAYGSMKYGEIMSICKKQTELAEEFDGKCREGNVEGDYSYSTKQLRLEREKLDLMGVN